MKLSLILLQVRLESPVGRWKCMQAVPSHASECFSIKADATSYGLDILPFTMTGKHNNFLSFPVFVSSDEVPEHPRTCIHIENTIPYRNTPSGTPARPPMNSSGFSTSSLDGLSPWILSGPGIG